MTDYTRPSASAADASFYGALAYTRPSASAADASWLSGSDTTIAATVAVVAAGDAAQGVSASGVATVGITAALDIDFTMPGVMASIEATVSVVAAGDAAHGVAGDSAATVTLVAAADAAHGVSSTIAATVAVGAAGGAAHGVAGDSAATVTLAASIQAVVERYELRGEVRLAGILVNRRVRAYRRDTGALVGEVDTVVGRFRLHAGFVGDVEHMVLPVDLSPDAEDWTPPVANRVLPALALDTA